MKAEEVARVVAWYRELARPFLEQHAADRLSVLDEQARRLDERAERARADEVSVCFLGGAGVGKSTLLNALVDKQVPGMEARGAPARECHPVVGRRLGEERRRHWQSA